MIKQILRYSIGTLVLVAIVTGSLLSHAKPAHAVTGSDWSAGNIISDGLFYNNTEMSIADIQNFLNSKVSSCDTQGTQSAADDGYPNLTHAQYAAQMGWPGPPYVCLKNYIQVPQTTSIVDNYTTTLSPVADSDADAICTFTATKSPAAGQGCSAAQIIKAASDAYNINPKALIVTLQKESLNLIYDTWPLQSQYKNAMGYGCPDTAPCSASYAGFYNQMNNAAWQFNQYKTNSSSYRYVPFQNNPISYYPNSTTCGASNVAVQDYATAGLYNYTPYQPDQAALNNLYGTGDSCSSYGNRNFWRTYNDWFGSTTGIDYSWEFAGQYAYTDSTKTTPVNLSTLMPGQRVYVGFYAKNTGNKTWSNTGSNPVRVGTTQGYNRTSAFYDSTWLGYGRPATLQQASVAPGQTGSFEFWLTVPPVSQITDFSEHFAPLAEGLTWMQDWGMYFSMRVTPPTYTWSLVGQAAYTDSTKATPVGLNNLSPGDRRYIELVIKNTGNTTWKNTGPNPIDLGTTGPVDRSSAFYDSTWLGYNRSARMVEASVAPGQNATFDFWLTAPRIGQSTTFLEHFTPVAEGITWMNDIGLNYAAQVNAATYGWNIVGQAAYTDSSKTTAAGLSGLHPGDRRYIELVIKNTGNTTWKNSGTNPVDLGATRPTDRSSIFYDPSWLGYNRSARIQEATVTPGQTATFDFWMTVPANATTGNYLEYFTPVIEGITWLQDIGLNYYVQIQ